eukprot:5654685-Amphidinium_carterae.3
MARVRVQKQIVWDKVKNEQNVLQGTQIAVHEDAEISHQPLQRQSQKFSVPAGWKVYALNVTELHH